MKIQSISIVVPTPRCVNNCKFCVSKMHDNDYTKKFDKFELKKRIKYAVMSGVTTCILTGTGEALQNREFLVNLVEIFREMDNPFPNVELQTSGVLLQKSIKADLFDIKDLDLYPNMGLLRNLGVNTISLSVSDILSDAENNSIIGVPQNLKFQLSEVINFIKDFGMNVRLSLNMTKRYDVVKTPEDIFSHVKALGANQLTFRKLYSEDNDSEESKWVKKNACKNKTLDIIKEYVQGWKNDYGYNDAHGTYLYTLPFGGKVYSIQGMSVVIDDDCMSKNNNEALKYLILREDGKLYCRWDDAGSLIF
jgi:hypothetical protein